MRTNASTVLQVLLRLGLGFLFLWPFFDKVFGLGFSTPREQAWISGNSPTAGFLSMAVKGPFSGLFHALSGVAIVDWLFMLGILFVGLALMLGIGIRIASISGAAILVLIYLASALPPEHNPILDDHLIYTLIFLGYAFEPGVPSWLGKKWRALTVVKKNPILE